ncbi:MAG: hypothetical protein HGB10_00280 [Coriobacteriia bacterium]|nr:hypothetical protein [Coriobacteriia bacterium]
MTRNADQVDINIFFGELPKLTDREDLGLQALGEMRRLDAMQFVDEHSELNDEQLAERLAERYGWTIGDAANFVVSNTIPRTDLIRGRFHRDAGSANDGNPATAKILDTIILYVRPQATKEEVANAFDEFRRAAYASSTFERRRPLAMKRSKDLAVLGYRIWRGEFDTWSSAFEAYQDEHPTDAVAFFDFSTNTVKMPDFRRATKNAYNTVTGCTLDFRPGMKTRKGGE